MRELDPPPLAVQLYTIREALREDAPAALARLASIGYRNVELFDMVGFGRPLADAVADAGLRAVSRPTSRSSARTSRRSARPPPTSASGS